MSQRPRIYLDHAATTPILPAAKAAMLEAMERWANPSSPHAEGRAARAALEDARERIKRALGWDGELIFTSGATEAIEIAMKRVKRERRVISPVEHDAVLRAAPDAEVLPLAEMESMPGVLEDALREKAPALVAIQALNSETGVATLSTFGPGNVTSPVLSAVHEKGGLLLCDCSQRLPRRYDHLGPDMLMFPQADLYVLSSHKIGGPPGIGALLVRELSMLAAEGGQEFGYRGGTENLPGVLGFAAAIEAGIVDPWLKDDELLTAMFRFKDFAFALGEPQPAWAVEHGMPFSAHIVSITMPRLSARAQLIQFDQMGFAVSAGSACSSGSLKPSRILKAYGVPDEVAARTIRVSFGWTTTVEDIHAFEEAWKQVADQAKRRAA